MKKRLLVFAQLIPVILSLLVLAAHCVRSGSVLLMFMSIGVLFALFVREPFIARGVQIVLLIASVEWLRFGFVFISDRMEHGQPWTRLAVIVGCVAIVTFASIFVFYTKALKEMYHLGEIAIKEGGVEAPAGGGGRAGVIEGASPEFLALYTRKTILNALSPLALLLMDFFMGFGVFALIAIGLANNSLRRKMNRVGGIAPLAEKRKNFMLQTGPMLAISGAIMVYFYLTMPTPITQEITISIVAVYAIFMTIVGYIEYRHKEVAC